MKKLALTSLALWLVGCPSSPAPDDAGALPGTDAPGEDVPGLDAPELDAPELDAPELDAGPRPPIEVALCDGNGVCDGTETCAVCPTECGSCDIARYASQRAKYVDQACAVMGDGLSDTCATSAGGPGRFNELQFAIDSLVAGDTLYIHPGDYWRDRTGTREFEGTYTVHGTSSGTAERPVVLTARFVDDPPTIHSCDPASPANCPTPALSTHGEEPVQYVIFDHLRIRGRAQLWGATRSVMQYLECTAGWGNGDGNWACLRVEAGTDCAVRFNHVHDVEGEADRGSGLKEFTSTRTTWELNTIESAPRWGYDHHRGSVDMTLRFNVFRDVASAIHSERGRNHEVYGNVMLATEACVDLEGVNEASPGPHRDLVHHNVCAFAALAYSVDPGHDATLESNANLSLPPGGSEAGNVNAPRAGETTGRIHTLDCNAYDRNSVYHRGLYDTGTEYATLAEWQALGVDATSIDAPGGACTFVDPPTDLTDASFDLHVSGGACATLACDGGEVGVFGLTDCVGHRCG